MYFVSFQVMRKLLSALLPNQEDRVLDSACDSKTEYWHDGRCCLYCWAGTRVLQHCTLPHTLGSCEKCPLGEFALKNGLETCMQCAQCREDQVKVGPCIGGINTKCQCKEGYYCENPDCEICQRCTERCPEGMEIFQGCNATADTHCGVSGIGGPQEGMGMLASWVPILILIFILILILGVCWLCIYCKKKRKCSLGTDTGRSPDESLETVLIKKSNGPVSTVPDSRSQSLEVEFDKVYALKDDTEPEPRTAGRNLRGRGRRSRMSADIFFILCHRAGPFETAPLVSRAPDLQSGGPELQSVLRHLTLIPNCPKKKKPTAPLLAALSAASYSLLQKSPHVEILLSPVCLIILVSPRVDQSCWAYNPQDS
ncbi:tumor necrosis factor receptor superfamily member 6-like isoform X1 [Petaurus breviceps papuanus]|uniref:tumor necrosis factor receptor superfamily member 6-like isoform X1 n=1 Tax=Petaurus breviceps papuanus TaxID=3040969 RepID=UPI0036DA4893